MNINGQIIISYIPVPHAGYRKFFERHIEARVLYVLSHEVISEFRDLSLHKQIQALEPIDVVHAIDSWNLFNHVGLLDRETLKILSSDDSIPIIMPNEDVSIALLGKYFSKHRDVVLDNVFLRWDRKSSKEKIPVTPDAVTTSSKFYREMIRVAENEGSKSSDWWRQVGAIVIKNREIVLVAHNKHLPDEQAPYIFGDPRSVWKRGVNIELSSSLHAEAGIIAQAAKTGISLTGSWLFVTDFPCPPCAKLVAYSGIRRLYYNKGYSVLDGEKVLRNECVEIIRVDKN